MSKGIIVQKYGGTSVADIARIQNVAKKVVVSIHGLSKEDEAKIEIEINENLAKGE